MLNDLQNETNYLSEINFDVGDVISSFNILNKKYISEWCTYRSLRHHDFFVGTRILRHTFALLITSTMNLELTSKVTTLALLYYIEFISQINLNNKGKQNAVLLGMINDATNTGTIVANLTDTHGDIHGSDENAKTEHVVEKGMVCGDISSGIFETYDSSNRSTITYHDVMLFVYNKTLSNIVKHYVKTNRKLEEIMTECDYYFRLNALLMRLLYNEKDSLNNAALIRKSHRKIVNILDSYLAEGLNVVQLQVVLIFVEYVTMLNINSKYTKRIMIMFLILPRALRRHHPQMTPEMALVRAATSKFEHRIIVSTPCSFVRWFIS